MSTLLCHAADNKGAADGVKPQAASGQQEQQDGKQAEQQGQGEQAQGKQLESQ